MTTSTVTTSTPSSRRGRRRLVSLAVVAAAVLTGAAYVGAAGSGSPGPSVLVPVTPRRVVDTRIGLGVAPGQTSGFELDRGTLGIPGEATASLST